MSYYFLYRSKPRLYSLSIYEATDGAYESIEEIVT